jgi:hypothetical protein
MSYYYLSVRKKNKKIFIRPLVLDYIQDIPGNILIDKKNFERLNEKSHVFMFDENTPEDEIVDFLSIHEFAI